MRPTPIQRFVAKLSTPNGLDSCWLWTGHQDKRPGWLPYGRFWFNGKGVSAHRWAYEAFVGPIPANMDLDHYYCENPRCVNPGHVRPVIPMGELASKFQLRVSHQ